ncbi:MAG: hypothetical protein H6626_09855 [Pseudobdellovibrionaceae bacterium]|nr:hypothetical protein [Bdellovibrionales bacterium]USN46517.1 MAG: hypothetical protein H6626_09855 [Pseudobdellovibrionaceae bacterium]
MNFKILVAAIVFHVGLNSYAAPLPATSSSEFIRQQLGVFRSDAGFTINSGDSDWVQELEAIRNPFVVTSYRAPSTYDGVQAALTVRVDKMSQSTTLKSYVTRWMRDFPRLGFKVMQAKPIKVSGQLGFVIDLKNQSAMKQLRQVLFLKDKTAVIMTCRDHEDHFQSTLKDCNEIIKNFRWL